MAGADLTSDTRTMARFGRFLGVSLVEYLEVLLYRLVLLAHRRKGFSTHVNRGAWLQVEQVAQRLKYRKEEVRSEI